MGNCIIKIEDQYFEWSTVVDAPITRGMMLVELEAYVKNEYGREGLEKLPARVQRADATGTSMLGHASLDDTISVNRAGPDESCISKADILKRYGRAGGGA